MRHALLHAELLFLRYGWPPLVAILLASVAAGLHGIATVNLREHIAVNRALLQSAALSPALPAEPAVPLQESRYAAFRALLIERSKLPTVVKTLLNQAARNRLVLKQVDYQLTRDPSAEYLVYRISVPIKGGYPEIRRFVAGVLIDTPAAALEEIHFKRESIGAPATEAKLHFAVFVNAGA